MPGWPAISKKRIDQTTQPHKRNNPEADIGLRVMLGSVEPVVATPPKAAPPE
jgi:hypothetical protein